MKLNWGTFLAMGMATFIIFIVSLGIRMAMSSDSVEEKNYYEKGLRYDERINSEKNTAALSIKPVILFLAQNNTLQINMPDKMTVESAELLLYKPDAAASDVHADVSVLRQTSTAEIDLKGLPSGRWIAKFNWQSKGKPYYLETPFTKP